LSHTQGEGEWEEGRREDEKEVMKRERSSREKIPAAHSVQASPEICQRATNPLLVTDPSLVKCTLMIPVVDVQLLPLDNTEFPDSSASATGESHDVAPLDDTQLFIRT
jgi:hypothetical protein